VRLGNWALRDHAGTIGPVRADLVDAVEVEAGGLIAQVVGDLDNNRVALGRLDLGARPLPIDADDGSACAAGTSCQPTDFEVVADSSCIGNGGQSQGSDAAEKLAQHSWQSKESSFSRRRTMILDVGRTGMVLQRAKTTRDEREQETRHNRNSITVSCREELPCVKKSSPDVGGHG
jgi:hypothetical protein